jgi:hypothetical protein
MLVQIESRSHIKRIVRGLFLFRLLSVFRPRVGCERGSQMAILLLASLAPSVPVEPTVGFSGVFRSRICGGSESQNP